ncbi:hypothetical protein [Streptomyces sp. NBC_00073]|uniref:hypothetical protein n=1 Tax=Streptomyces sp. NBC_00073 TaxID=2975640 RepID=UPI0032507850
MHSVLTSYWNGSLASFHRFPVWLPGNRMALGDVGVLAPDGWSKSTDLVRLEVATEADAPGAPSDYDHSDGASLSFVTGASAGAVEAPWLPSGHVGLRLDFTRAGAFVLKAKGVRVTRIGNLAEVESGVLDLYRRGLWRREWVLVTEVAVGGPVIVVVARESGARAVVDLGAEAVAGGLDLGRVRGSLGVGFRHGLAAQFATRERSAVLWRGMYVSDGLIGGAKLKHRGDEDMAGRWGRRPPGDAGAPELYLTEPQDLREILAAPEPEPEADAGSEPEL